jgi:hypothetical protein
MKKEILLRILIFFILSLKVNIFYAQVPNYVPSSGLVGWWPFDGNANDESGNGNNGTVTGATLSDDRNGIPNKAYYFSSSGCGTRIDANVNTTTIQSGLSISIWVLRSGNGCIGPRIFEFWPGNNGPGQAQWGWDNSTSVIGMGSTTSTGFGCNSSVPIPANNVWIHLVYTNDGSVGKFYSNGNLVSTVASNGNPILAGSVSFGRMNHPSWDAFNGKLDDIGVWSRALTECEVQQLYLSQTSVSGNIVDAGPDQTICSGSSVILTATGANNYSWTGGIQNGVPFVPTASSQYIVTGTDGSGCTGIDTVNVNVVPTPVITVTNDTICTGQSTTLTATGLLSSQSNCIGNPGSPNPWPFPSAANGGYMPLGTFGAQNVFSISMWINPATVQNGVSIILDASHGGGSNWVIQTLNSGSTWTWGNGVFTLTPNNWQHLLLTYDNGVRKIFINGIEVQTWNQVMSYSGSPALYLGNWPEGGRRFNGLIDELYITNDIQYTANFSPLETIQTISPQTFGLWHFDEGSGQSTINLPSANFPLNNWYWATRPLSASYTLSWTPGGATTPSITVSPTTTTNYTCIATNSNGFSCSTNQNIVVAPLQVYAGPDLTVVSGSSVTLTATGGSSYSWTGGIQNGVSFVPTSTQTYVVTGTNNQGCVGVDTVVVNVVPPPSISIAASATSICAGDSITLTAQLNQPLNLSLSFPYSKLTGSEIWVSPSGSDVAGTGSYSNPYQTIQYAVNIASNAQIVTLKNGTYSGAGNVNVTTLGKQITVQSENGPLVTIIDCNQAGRAFIANSGESMSTIIKGIKILNGKTNSAPIGYGSAIFVEDNSGLKIVDCIFQNNIEGCVQFGDNEVSGPQSGIENCSFIQNQVSCISSAKKSFYTESCFFYNNTSNGELIGNGHVANPAQYYQNCIFKCNSGNIIGALGHGKLMNNSLFIGNTSAQGTIYMGTNWSGTNTIDHCTFYNNTCNYYNSGWYDHTGQVLSSIFYPGDARNHVSGNQGQIPFSNSLGGNITGNGNIQGTPLFVNPSSNNFQLQPSSPCVGTGASGTNMGANVSLIQPWLFNFLDYYSQGYPSVIWSNGATTPSITLTPSASGYVHVTYSGCGNMITDSIFIQISPLTTVDAGQDVTVCLGNAISLQASGALTYTWSGGVQNGISFTPTSTQTYVVTGTNSSGCTGVDSVLVTVLPDAIIDAGQDQTICSSSSVTLTASGASVYTWSGGIQNGISFTPTSTQTYIVTGTNSSGCTGIDSVTINVVPTPIITALDSVICVGDTTTLSVSAIGIGPGTSCSGTSPVNYLTWTPIAAIDSYVNILKEGSVYYLRSQSNVFQSNSLVGPWSSMNFNTQIGNTLAGRMLGTDWSNRLVVSTGHNSLYANNNGAWQDIGLGGFGCGGNFIHKLANNRIIVMKGGYLRDLYISDNNAVNYTNVTNVDNDYWDMIVAPNGNVYACGGSNTLSMTGIIKSTNNGSSFTQINSQLGISYCSGFAKDCSGSIYAVGDNKIFKSVDGNTWSQHTTIPAYFTTNPGISYLVIGSNGDYYYWGYSGASQCALFKSSNQGLTWTQVTDLGVPAVDIYNLKEIDGNIVVATNQGVYAKTLTQAASYTWSTGATTQTISVNPTQTTTYTVTVDYGNGVLCSSSFVVNVNPTPTINAGQDQTICSGSSVTLMATGASNIGWTNGVQNGVSFLPTLSQTYVVSGMNSNGCTGVDSVLVTLLPNAIIDAGQNQTICSGNAVILNASGTSVYTWSGGVQNGISFTPTSTQTYVVTGTNSSGCTGIDSVLVTVLPNAIIDAGQNQTICSSISVTLTASGASVYTWSGGIQNGISFTPTSTQTYVVTGTNSSGCTGVDSVLVTVLPNAIIDAGTDQSICSSISVTLTASGASVYTWSGGVQNGISFTPTSTQTYVVTGTNSSGCTGVDSVLVTVLPNAIIDAGQDQIICLNTPVSLQAIGASTYTWSGGVQNGISFTPTSTQTYVVTGTNSSGCTGVDSVLVTVLPNAIIDAGQDQIICLNTPVSLQAIGASTYTWSGGVQNGISFTPTSTQTYVVTGTNSSGCTGVDSVLVTVLPNAIIDAGQDQTICSSSSVTLTASGASVYTWSGGIQNGIPFFPTASGQYIVSGTNSFGCSGLDTVQVTVVPNPVITALDSVICAGDTTQLTASAPTIGAGQSCTGTSPVNYTLWTPIAVTDSYTNIIKEGTNYFLRAQNNVYQSSSLIGPWSSMNFNTQIGNTLAGRMFGMDWNNRLFVSTGHNSLYAYNNGAWLDMGLGGFGCSGNFIHKLANGRIIVEKNGYLRDLYISDNNGASFTNVTNVDNDYFDMIVAPNGNIYACGGSNTPSMTGLIKSTNNGTSFTQINSQLGIAYCSGFAKDCSGSIYAVADNKIFKSIDGNTWQQQCLIPSGFTTNPGYSFLVVASNGDYYLWGYANTSINGLYKSSNLGQTWSQITDLPVPVANVTNLKEIDGNIVVVTTQGIYAKTILQSPNFVWSTGATTPTITVSPSTTTTYTVTVDYGNGLTCSSSFTITVNQLPLVNAGIDQSVCAGSSVTLSATGATNYSWSGGVQNGVAFVPSTSGQYIVTSTNSGCVGLDTVEITVNSNPTVSGTVTNPLCNTNQTGEISISISSGQAPYTVLWSNGASSNSIQNLSSGNYLVTITDTNNCSASQSYSIVSPSPLSISSVVANSNCTNSATGAIDISVSGGTAPYFYTWSNGATIQDLTNLLGGTFAVTVTDNNGCTVSDSFQITQTTGLSITANVVNPTCGTTNNGLIDISVFGGTPAYAYLWSNGSSTQDLSGLGTGTYSVSVTDSNGCVATGVYTLTAPIPLSISFTNNNIGCFGDSTGYINSNVTGGQSPYSYFWNTGANTPNITNVIAGTYILTVNDAGGCTSTSSVQIYQPQLPLVISAAITPSQCFGANNGSIDIFATGGTVLYNYNWSNGATTQDLQNISAGNYSLILTDGNGCIYDTAFVVSQPALPLTSQTSQVNVSCQNGNNGFVNLTVSGGQQPYSYNWSNGQTTQDLLSLSAGTYTLILTDGNGCIAYDTVTIVQPSIAFSLGGVITNVACFGASTGFIDLNVSGGMAPYTYIWNNGGSIQDLSNLQAGNYNVIVFDANNCQESQTFSITQPTFDLQANTVVENLICTSNETGSIDVTVTGGTSPYSYLWTNGQTVQDLINVGTGNYSLTISDNNGCQITLSENISAPAQPLTTSAQTGNVSCFGLSDGQITLATLGGVSPYVYQWSNGQTASLIDSLTAGLYSVLVTDANGCENSLSVQITQPNQILNNFSSSSQLGCIPAQIDFTYPVNDPTLSFSWDFGNGQSSNLQNPSFTYLSAGCSAVSLTITAANGCVVNSILDSMICIVQGPEAAFYSTASTIDFYTGELALFDNSEGSILSYLWTLGDSSPNQTTQNIIHYYTPYTEENYNVSLTVTDTNGCSDVATMVFSLIEEFEIYVPNTITLNGDLLNDGFLPIFSNVDILKDYELVIYNRWGNLVWQTTNPTEPWFGRYKDAYDVQVGSYTWKIKYTDNKSVTRSLVGHVNVLK